MEAEDFSHHFPEKELVDYLNEVLVDMDSALFQLDFERIVVSQHLNALNDTNSKQSEA